MIFIVQLRFVEARCCHYLDLGPSPSSQLKISIVSPAHAHRTVSLVPGAELRIVDDLGHLGVAPEIIPALTSVLPSG
jgi:hypothetical protein